MGCSRQHCTFPAKVDGMKPLYSLAAALLLVCNGSAETIQLGARRELFVDRFLIGTMTNAELRLHEPRRDGPAILFDKPWDGGFSAYVTVFKDGDVYRMYYRGSPKAGHDGNSNESVCYAESKDGMAWTKPDLELFEVAGTKHNNVVLTNAPYAHNFSPFRDEAPSATAGARYKALAGLQKGGLHAFASADALHWNPMQAEPVFTRGAFDSQNVAFWSVTESQYVCYFRTWKQMTKDGFRWISRTTSKDFVHWTEPEEMEFGDTAPEHLYTNGTHPYYRAPHIYIALAKRFFPNKVALPSEQARKLVNYPGYRIASSDSILMTTRGGTHYERAFMDAFIRPGPDPEDWISRDNMPACGVVPGDARTMFIYRMSHYAQPSAEMTRYSLRTDGFISVHAAYAGGEMVTKPFTFSGSQLSLNFQSSAAGGVRVELQDKTGKVLMNCAEMMGDEIDRDVTWSQGGDLRRFAGKTVRLRFILKDADLYSLQFHD